MPIRVCVIHIMNACIHNHDLLELDNILVRPYALQVMVIRPSQDFLLFSLASIFIDVFFNDRWALCRL